MASYISSKFVSAILVLLSGALFNDCPTLSQSAPTATAAVKTESADELCELGRVEAEKRNYRKAIDYFIRSLQLDPRWVESLSLRGDAYMRLHEYQKAAADYRTITERYPDAGGESELAEALYRLGRYEEAIKYFGEAINPDPSIFNRGVVYMKLSNWNGAIEDFSSILKRHPKCAPCLLNRSIAYSHVGKKQEASADRKEAYTLEPKLRRVIFHDIYPMKPGGVPSGKMD
jgi:tetratricopeptide (TPR) repeat protein